MSLLEWSTPERNGGEQVLPAIPIEIYIYIFELIAPLTGRLTPQELRTLSNLSGVCRFFADFCLPRVFEFLEFSDSIASTVERLRHDTIHKTSRGATLCSQIIAKQPLALSLAKKVKSCRFTKWQPDDTRSCPVEKCFAGMSHMRNIRELKFSASFVVAAHWSAIAALDLLEELIFDSCYFMQGPAEVEPEKRVMIKASHLQLTYCVGCRQPIAVIDPLRLRTLVMDCKFFDQVDQLPQSALTELRLIRCRSLTPLVHWCFGWLRTILAQAPQSVEELWLPIDLTAGAALGMLQSAFDDPAWKNLPHLRSLKLVLCRESDTSSILISFLLDCIPRLANLQSFTLEPYKLAPDISPIEVQRILQDRFGSSSSLKYADIYGRAFRLANGEWTVVSCNTT